MTGTRLHDVVFCVRAENQERAADFWRDLGLTFVEIPLVVGQYSMLSMLAWVISTLPMPYTRSMSSIGVRSGAVA